MVRAAQGDSTQATDLKSKLDHILDEIRVVLPGTQALMGFQLIAVFSPGFDKLTESMRYLHLASLGFVALSIALLMAPAAYHQIVDRGEDSEALRTFASHVLIAAMICLSLGLAGDLLVVVRLVTGHLWPAIGVGGVALGVFGGLWFGYTLAKRSAARQAAAQQEPRRPSSLASRRR